jgi:hypothetical protein
MMLSEHTRIKKTTDSMVFAALVCAVFVFAKREIPQKSTEVCEDQSTPSVGLGEAGLLFVVQDASGFFMRG